MSADGEISYSYKPSVLGAAWAFKLRGRELSWQAGRNSGCVDVAKVRRVRMAFKPMAMQTQRFVTEVWADGAGKLAIVSTSWKNPLQMEQSGGSYSAFLYALHRAIADANPNAHFERGMPALKFWLGAGLFVVAAIGMLALLARAIWEQAWAGAIFIAAFGGFFAWQTMQIIRRNKPGAYSPSALPDDLLPPRP